MKDPYARGLVVGRFAPLEVDQERLIETGLAQCRELTVLVGSSPGDPIPGGLRYGWVRQRFPRARVVHVRDAPPGEPGRDASSWRAWSELARQHHPEPIDVVFSLKGEGAELARSLGTPQVRVERAGKHAGAMETAIRDDPMAHWEEIAPVARPYFVRRVLLTGAESTGKTTLAERLAAHYRTTVCREYARRFCDERGGIFQASDQVPIAFGHLLQEEEAVRTANRVTFTDTDAIVTGVYFDYYFGWVDPRVMDLSHRERYDLVLLLHPDVPWVRDPQRDLPVERVQIHERIREGLQQRQMTWVDVRGDWETRWKTATAAVDRLLGRATIPSSPARKA